MRVAIYIGNDKISLYKDENMSVKSSVLDIQDITKNTTDFTKTFTVPADDENNKTFKHYYDADIDNGFDARIKVDGRIELDGMLFRKGKFRMSKARVNQNKPSSYTITFWGSLLTLNDLLGKDELSDLPLSEFDHSYDGATVLSGLKGSLFNGDLVYSLLAKKQYYYNSDPTDTFINDELANVAWGNGSGSNGIVWNDLSASLKIIKLIEAIETKYPITFSRQFFGRSEFTDIFFWMNRTSTEETGTELIIDWDGGNSPYLNLTTNKGDYPPAPWVMKCSVIPDSGFENIEYTVRIYINDAVAQENTFVGSKTQEFVFSVIAETNAYWTVSSSSEFEFSASLSQSYKIFLVTVESYTSTSSSNAIASDFTTSNNLPKLQIIDFLKGLFNAFKLVVIPLPDGTTYVNTLNSYYTEGNIYDITRYVDFSSYDVDRGKILNEINFLFSEPSTILNKQFEENTRIAYGDAEIKLADENGEILDGEPLEFTLPFEQILYERLTDQNDTFLTNFQYGAVIDQELNPVNPKLHLYYNINQNVGSKTIAFVDEFGTKSQITTTVNTPSHTIGFNTSNFALLFDSEFSTWNGQKINNTLYTNYHEPYILSIFNVKKRSFSYKAKNFPLSIMLKLGLNDLLRIKETYHRIDNFVTNLLTGDVTFNLVNSFDTTVNLFQADPSEFLITYDAQQVSSYVTNLGNFIQNKVDAGSGTGWVAVTNDTNNLYFDVDQNNGGVNRIMFIDVTNTDTLQEIRITINQAQSVVTADNDEITADSDFITADNG